MTEQTDINLGSIRIHKDVIRQIVIGVVQEDLNAFRIYSSFSDKLARFFKPSSICPIKVSMGKETVKVKVPLVASCDQNLSEVASGLQEKIAARLKEQLGVSTIEIDIDIRGIEGR